MTAIARGRVLARPAALPRSRGLLILLPALPLFMGSFQYVVDLPALYALSKAWPALMLPFTLFAMGWLRPPYQPLLLAVCAWLIGVTPFIGILQLGNDIVGALASTAKIWPLTGALSAAAMLVLARPDNRTLGKAIAILALTTFTAMVAAFVLAPPEAFTQTIEETKVFLTDPERGKRINAPMALGLMGLFMLNRSFWKSPALWKAAGVVLAFVLMIIVYKQRAPIAGAALTVLLGAALSLGRWRGLALALLGAGFLASAVPLWLWVQSGDVAGALGGSLTMRQQEAEAAVAFLGAEPWRWVFGVGSATRIGDVTLGDIVGMAFFFPSDLGWLGVVFEYGLIGAALMLAVHLACVRLSWRASASGNLTAEAVLDYSLYLLIVSPIVSVALAPGEVATCLALAWWVNRSCAAVRSAP